MSEKKNIKINDIADNELSLLDVSLCEISTAAASTYSLLEHFADVPRKEKNDVLYMLSLIKKLTEEVDSDLMEIIEKLCKLTHKTE